VHCLLVVAAADGVTAALAADAQVHRMQFADNLQLATGFQLSFYHRGLQHPLKSSSCWN